MASGGDVDLALSLAARFLTVGEAQAAATALDAAGIDCHLADQNLVGVDWAMAQAVGGIKVLVPDEDLERAQEILSPDQYATEDRGPRTEDNLPRTEDEPAAQCPECGSRDFQSVPRFRIFLLIAAIFIGIGTAVGEPLLAVVALIAVAFGAILMPSARCASCSHRWSPPPPARRRVEAPLPDANDMIEEKCPRCGSIEVYRINDRRLKAIPLLFNPAIFVVVPLWLLKSKRRCDACGLTLP
jgi:Zn finger protein HypA/HybF involved in hydrogenase expression